jgi:actin-related protein
LLKNLPERLEKEVAALIPQYTVRVVAPAERQYLVWIGGSHLAALGSIWEKMVSREEYEKEGAAVVHTKCS